MMLQCINTERRKESGERRERGATARTATATATAKPFSPRRHGDTEEQRELR
jgi:hypothetical protein